MLQNVQVSDVRSGISGRLAWLQAGSRMLFRVSFQTSRNAFLRFFLQLTRHKA